MKISIILPTFNRSKILKNTIQNIQNQTFQHYELIIINDASTDATNNIVQKFQHIDSRIKLINNIKNLGCAKSREIGLEHSTNELIVFIDDDDEWDKQKLMQQYNAIIKNDSDIVISDYYILKNKNKIYKKMNLIAQNFKYQILKRPGLFFQCVMMKKKILQSMKSPFDSNAIPSEDWNFFIELSKLNLNIFYINEPLFTWKIHNNNQSLNLTKEARALEYIITKHYDYIKSAHNTKMIANHYRRIARIYEKINNFKEVKRFYIQAFQTYPMSWKNIFYYIAAIMGYQYSHFLIKIIRKIRGVPND